MSGRLKKSRPPDRDRIDDARLKLTGTPAHINAIEDRLLGKLMPESHGKVTRGGLLAEEGRGGDDRVTLLTPKEQKLLALLGGSGAANPATGLLEMQDGNGTGTAGDGNTGMGGNGSVGDPGPGQSGGPSSAPGGGNGYSGYNDIGVAPPGSLFGPDRVRPDLSYYDGPVTTESLMNTPNGFRADGYEGISMMQYSPPDTFGRLWDVFRHGPPPSYKALGAVPGRYGMPTARGPGIVGTAVANFGGPMMSAAMALGNKFDQAMSPATRAASLAENQATGSRNSTGNDARQGHTVGQRVDAFGSPLPEPGAGTAGGLLADGTGTVGAGTGTIAPGGVTTPAAMTPFEVADAGGGGSNTVTGLPVPIQNLLMDYIFRGWKGNGYG